MPAMSQSEMKEWADDFLEAMGTPQDWSKLKGLVSKRVTVTLPCNPSVTHLGVLRGLERAGAF